MSDESVRGRCKVVSNDKLKVIRKLFGRTLTAFKVSKINVNKVVFNSYEVITYSYKPDKSKICIADQIEDSMILKVSSNVIDKIINLHGDFVFKVIHEEGVVTDVIMFEDIEIADIDVIEKCFEDIINKALI